MKKLLSSVVATALCAVSLCAVAAPRAHAANPKVVYTGHLVKAAVIPVGVDGAKNVDINKIAQGLTDQFTGTDWNVMDNHSIIVSKSGKAVITLPFSAASKDLYEILIHARSKDLTTGM